MLNTLILSYLTVALTDNFVLVADWTHHKVYQVSLLGEEIRALDTNIVDQPYGVVCDPVGGALFWTDTSEYYIHSFNMKASVPYSRVAYIGKNNV